jgi:hypothetical protein
MLFREVPCMVAHRNPRSGMRQTGTLTNLDNGNLDQALGFPADACKREIRVV